MVIIFLERLYANVKPHSSTFPIYHILFYKCITWAIVYAIHVIVQVVFSLLGSFFLHLYHYHHRHHHYNHESNRESGEKGPSTATTRKLLTFCCCWPGVLFFLPGCTFSVALKGVSQMWDLTPTPYSVSVRDEGRRGPALLIFTTVPLCRRVVRESASGVVVPLYIRRPFLCRRRQEDYRQDKSCRCATSCDLSSLRPLPRQR